MSNYIRNTRNPKTGKFEPAFWLDDHFGRHRYGVKFQDGKVYDPEKVKLETNHKQTGVTWQDYPKTTIQDVVNNTVEGQEAVDNALKRATERQQELQKAASSLPDTAKVTRFEVIDHTGVVLIKWKEDLKVTLDLQDGGRTLKVFLSDREGKDDQQT